MTRARLERIGLSRFRSYAHADIECDGRPVCIYGPNGAGKTNLLEAISMLAVGRGLRGAALNDLNCRDGHHQEPWRISFRFGEGRALAMTVHRADERSRRAISLDGTPITPLQLSDMFAVLWLTPVHDRIFAGPRAERRRFFDRLILARSSQHGALSARYERAGRERNSLLKQGVRGAWLDAVEDRIAEAGARIAVTRTEAIAELQDIIDSTKWGCFPAAAIRIVGEAEDLARTGTRIADIADRIRADLHGDRERDTEARRATRGVHRTDFAIANGNNDMPAALCSTGERKALLLGLIIAAAHAYFRDDTDRISLLLLDDAVAYLDSERRNSLYDRLADINAQAWLSGTDAEPFAAFGSRAQFFRINDSRIHENADLK